MGEFLPALVTAAVGLILLVLVLVLLLVLRSVHRVRRASAALRLDTGERATSLHALVNSRRRSHE
jgi:fumarate reductase subunit D